MHHIDIAFFLLKHIYRFSHQSSCGTCTNCKFITNWNYLREIYVWKQTEKKSKFKLKLQQCEETQEEIERIDESEQKKTNNNQSENSVQVQCCVVLWTVLPFSTFANTRRTVLNNRFEYTTNIQCTYKINRGTWQYLLPFTANTFKDFLLAAVFMLLSGIAHFHHTFWCDSEHSIE